MDTSSGNFLLNHSARNNPPRVGRLKNQDYDRVAEFFAGRPDLHTPLRSLPGIAADWGVAELLVKDESNIGGLDSFKIRGVSYAVSRLLEQGEIPKDAVLACATDGNHGRAVARVARNLNLKAQVFVPQYTVPARIEAIRREGAEVTIISGGYDETVRAATKAAELMRWKIVSDASWPGYEEIPSFIMAGYASVLEECAHQWGSSIPDVVFVQAGVGGFACAMLHWLWHTYGTHRPYVVSCEPLAAPCVLESFRARRRIAIETRDTVMAGLNCGEVSLVAFPFLVEYTDAFLAIPDTYACQAVYRLAHPTNEDNAIISGTSGACGLASLWAVLTQEEFEPLRKALHLGKNSKVLVFNTEGATDPELNDRILTGTDARI